MLNLALKLVKTATDVAVSMGAGAITGNLIKNSTPADAKKVTKVAIGIGGFVISSAVGSWASNYATEQIDGTVEQIAGIKDAFKSKPRA